MNLSEHFTLDEMTKSATGTRNGIINNPNAFQISNLQNVCEKILEPVRKHYNRAVVIYSGYRCPELNALVGGAKNSQHMSGEAVDFYVPGFSNPEVAEWVRDNCTFDQIILEFYDPTQGPNSGWVHASYSSSQSRKSTLTAKRVNGKTVYVEGFVVA